MLSVALPMPTLGGGMRPGSRAVDPEGAAVEQLYEKRTSLGKPWGAEQEIQQKGEGDRKVQWLRLWSESARVQILPLPPQRYMALESYPVCLGFPFCEMGDNIHLHL